MRAKEAAQDDNNIIMEITLSRKIAIKKICSVAKALVVYILWTTFSPAGIIIDNLVLMFMKLDIAK